MEEVIGSIPIRSTNYIQRLSGLTKAGVRVSVDEIEIDALSEKIIRFASEVDEKLAKRKTSS